LPDLFDRLKAALADRYALEREVGSGGMATVYLAEDLKHRRQVAVKVLRPELAAALGADRFLREIEIAAQLQHPHILPLYDSGEADDFLFYVMPYVGGESLRGRLERSGELPIPDAVRILREVADALAHAHSHGVVHRDIKPDNVMLTGRHALVADFGVAKAVSEATGRHQITTAGVALGTPFYMAPEQASADPGVDHRADIYAMGALAYELLTGRPPFTGTTPQAILTAHLTETPEPVSSRRRAVPPALEQVVMRSLEKNPADRWQSTDEMLGVLEGLSAPSGGVTPSDMRPASAGESGKRGWFKRLSPALAAAAIVALAAGVWFARGWIAGSGAPELDRRAIAVLPFANLSGDPDTEPFTNGIHDDIIGQLARIEALRVISRTSVMEYQGTAKNVREIGRELGVGSVLEGGVQRAGNTVRINVQMIDAVTDEHLWSDVYDRELTAHNIFEIQSDIAQQVAGALQATLSPAERARIAARPTESLEAYDYYVRGLEDYFRGYDEEDFRAAITWFERAIAEDPSFGLAHAQLSRVHGLMWWFFYDRSETRLRQAEDAVDEALRLAPDDYFTRVALGERHYRLGDFDAALEELTAARQIRPHDAEALFYIGYVQRRSFGMMEEATVTLVEAAELDPRSAVRTGEIGSTFVRLRNASEARRYFDRAMALDSGHTDAYESKARQLQLRVEGDVAGAGATLELAAAAGVEHLLLDHLRILVDILDRRYEDALGRLAAGPEGYGSQHIYADRDQLRGWVYQLRGEPQLASAYYDSARVRLERLVREAPEDGRYRGALGIVYAALGRRDDAIREAERGVELVPLALDALRGFYRIEDLARVYAAVGEHDRAVERLEYLLSIPGDLTPAYLAIDPSWQPLREHPGFQSILARHD
jgi:serine/threonine-protein kinase